ncbi:MAG: hypothetical protein LBQ65_03310, partial [Tannerellaceae bacterium]|nr:hypothetical protein [Tannerellaceae bacterium]
FIYKFSGKSPTSPTRPVWKRKEALPQAPPKPYPALPSPTQSTSSKPHSAVYPLRPERGNALTQSE